MPKKTTILIVILALITGVLIFLAVRNEQTQEFVNNALNNSTPTPTEIAPYTTLGFSISELNATASTTPQTVDVVDVVVDTNGNPMAGIQLEMSYDPEILTNMKINKPAVPFLGDDSAVLINKIDPVAGRISYAVGINVSGEEKTGKGVIATLSFTINNPEGMASTQISFLPKSMATSFSTADSVLKGTTPLRINLSSTTPPINN
jgi:hypothetical protein